MTPIRSSLVVADAEPLHRAIAGHLSGDHPLTGLGLYYELERTTSLLEFHTMLREGARNHGHDGLQQSYGDHNRLLMLGLDRLLDGDVNWLRARVAPDETIDAEALARCAADARDLDLPPDAQVALWLGAGLHDCGMLLGQGAHVDVEDGVAIARPVLDELCPPATRPVAELALRHHDYIKDVFLGEVPVGLVADDLAGLDPDPRALTLGALGLIQVAGAASLGTGRLTNLRLRIFRACFDGTALADRSPATRLARLLGTTAPAPAADLDALAGFLDRVSVHGWHPFVRDADASTRIETLHALAAHDETRQAQHVVIADELRARGDGVLPVAPATSTYVARSGSVIVTVLP